MGCIRSHSVPDSAARTRELRVCAPGTGACKNQIEEYKAEENGELATVERRKEVLWCMRHEVGDRHVAREDEGHRSGE